MVMATWYNVLIIFRRVNRSMERQHTIKRQPAGRLRMSACLRRECRPSRRRRQEELKVLKACWILLCLECMIKVAWTANRETRMANSPKKLEESADKEGGNIKIKTKIKKEKMNSWMKTLMKMMKTFNKFTQQMKLKTTLLQTSSTLKFNLSTLMIINSKQLTTSTTVWRWKWTKMTSLT